MPLKKPIALFNPNTMFEATLKRGHNPQTPDLLISLFNELMEEYPQYRSFIPEVTESMVREVIEGLHMRVRTQAVVDLVMKRYDLITKT